MPDVSLRCFLPLSTMPPSVATRTNQVVAAWAAAAVLAGGVLGLAGLPRPAGAAEPPRPVLLVASDPRVGLSIDASALEDDGDTVLAKVDETARGVLIDSGFVHSDEHRDPRIMIVIEPSPDPENPGYVVGFSMEQAGEIVPNSSRQSDCSLCTRTELIDLVAMELPPLLDLARSRQVEPEPEPELDEGGGDAGEDDAAVDEGPEPTTKPVGPLGFAGVGVGVLGLAGVGAGAALVAQGQPPIAGTPDLRDFATPGYATLAVGGAALVAGVVMIAVDVSKRKRQRRAETAVRWTGLGLRF